MRRPLNNEIERATDTRRFTEGDPRSGERPTKVSAEALNTLWDELCHLVEFTGDVLDDSGTDTQQIRRAVQWVTGEGYRVGTHLLFSWDVLPPSPAWPWFRLTQPDAVVYDVQWPLYVEYLRARQLIAQGQVEFAGTVTGNGAEATIVLAASAAADELLATLAADADQHGSFANWYTANLAADSGGIDAGDYSITDVDAATRTIRIDVDKTLSLQPITGLSIYPHRVPNFADRARHFQNAGQFLRAAGDGIAGTRSGVPTADTGAGQLRSIGLQIYAFGLRYVDAPLPPLAPTVTVANGGYRRSLVSVSAGNAATITLYHRTGQAPSATEFDGSVTFNGQGPHEWIHDDLTPGETYYYTATSANASGESVPATPASITKTATTIATYDVAGSFQFDPPPGVTRVQVRLIGGGGQGGGGGAAFSDDGDIGDGGGGGGGGSGEEVLSELVLIPGTPVPLVVAAGGNALGTGGEVFSGATASGGAKGKASTFGSLIAHGGAGGGGAANAEFAPENGSPGEDSGPFRGGDGGEFESVPAAPFFIYRAGAGGEGANAGQDGEDGDLLPGEIRDLIRRAGGAGGLAPYQTYGAGGRGGDGGTISPGGYNPTYYDGQVGEAGTSGLIEVIA